ncbi:hypothetical protein MKZ38_010187 [Zalerion maritima]|uniref:Flo11 n=1 Tax=Zalerion maritima TaxID=339359 RepID=A0AAD5WT32_9PEZI|nr:hypothetical protein MKZ38_010187 [Zalerion maritima]
MDTFIAPPALGTSRPSSGITSPITKHSRSRTQSISSDRPSTIAYSLMSPPLTVSPEAAFIAASAASQIVTNDHDSHADRWYDQYGIEPSGETALVSAAALSLVNNFLDQLLFNFLCASKSTSLTSLRPAVSEVLKPKLAKDAINLADEELREYLGSGEDDDILRTPSDPGNDWDIELVWKRTRLRCMVYSSLGDMEEEDEDYYLEQDQLSEDPERLSDVVSPAVAIFLTSILEFMGEQALIVAGQAAYNRMRLKHERELNDGIRSPSDASNRIVVEELDMERVALDRTLGRLWRAWKKRIRSPVMEHPGLQRSFSRSSMRSGSFQASHFRQESTLVGQEPPSATKSPTDDAEPTEQIKSMKETVEEWVHASQIPLPMRDGDVNEIEVPGLTSYSDDEDAEEGDKLDMKPRPKSLTILPIAIKDLPTPKLSQPVTPVVQSNRKRSNSLPTPTTSPPQNSLPKRPEVEQQIPTQLESDATDGTVPISTEEISSEASAAPASAATAVASPVDNEEANPDATPKPRKIARRPVPVTTQPSVIKEKDEPAEAVEGDIEEFTEEAQVLNFSRVSVAGGISPTSSSSESGSGGKPQPINTALPVRTPSIHSARLVDVATPRSPRSRQGSLSAERRHSQDHHAVVVLPPASIANSCRVTPNVSRTNSYSSQPSIVEEPGYQSRPEQRTVSPVGRAAAPSPLSREVATFTAALERSSSKQPRQAELSTREESLSPPQRSLPGQAITTPANTAQQSIFGSVSRQSPQTSPSLNKQPSPPPASSTATTTTKVTVISSSHGNSFFDLEERPEVPTKPMGGSAQHSRREVRGDVLPPVPERSSNRHTNESSGSQHAIGMPSVEPHGRESPERSSGDTKSGSRSRHHASENSASSTVSGGKYKPMRTSDESTRAKPTVVRDFEELIKSDTTIQYTLTPENMRDIDSQSTRSFSNSSPAIPVKVRKSEDRPTATRSRSSSDNKSMDLRRTASVNKPSSLSSQPISELKGPVPRAPAMGVSGNGRGAAAQARDARVTRDSMADFAKWIRSTGPDAVPGPAPMSGAMSARNASGPPSILNKSSMETSRRVDTASSAGSSSTTRPKLLAREATVSSQDETSDLIDFIRRGPPSSNPRIPRAVAPFRTTMDSDQLNAAIGGKAVDASLPDIRYSGGTAQTEPSIHSSVDSRSALLSSSSKPSRAHGGYGGASAGVDEDDGMPKRTRRGPRDPYAIDFSDDSDADLFDRPPPKPATKKEESLAEFLMNCEPPKSRAMSPPPPPPVKKPKKKASAPSLMARFTRSHYHHPPVSHSVPHSTTGSANGLDASSISSKATNGTGRGYIPIQVSMPHGSEAYGGGSSKSNLSVQSGPAVPGGTGRRVPMKRVEPREAVSAASRTNDLADFLMNSEPPNGAVASAPNLDQDGRPQRRRMKF